MHSIPPHLKLILFEKKEDEPLSSDEQEMWEEYIASEQSQPIYIIPDEPLFKEALELYLRLKDEQIATWEKFEEQVLQRTDSLPVKPASPVMKKFNKLKWFLLVAAVLLIIFLVLHVAAFM